MLCVCFCRDSRDSPSFVLVWSLLHSFSKISDREWQRWLPNAKEEIRGSTCGKSAGGPHHDRWEEGMDLFRIQCMDAVALQAMLLQHPGMAAGIIQAGDCGENG